MKLNAVSHKNCELRTREKMEEQTAFHQSLSIKEREREKEEEQEQEPKENPYDFRVLYFAFFAIYLGRTLILPLLPSFGNALWRQTHSASDPSIKKLPDDKQGILSALFYVAYAVSGIAFGPLSLRIGRKPVLLGCIVGITFGFIGQALSTNYWCLVCTRTVSGFFAAINGLCQWYISDVCAPHHVPEYTAKLGTVFGLVFGFGPLFAVILCKVNEGILGMVGDSVDARKYQLSLAFGACITGFSSFLVAANLKESLPSTLRVPWRANKDKESERGMKVEVLSVIAHPDYDDVSKLILNVLDGQRITNQLTFCMKHCEDAAEVANRVILECGLNPRYLHHLIAAIKAETVGTRAGDGERGAFDVDLERDLVCTDCDDEGHGDRDGDNDDDDDIDFAALYLAMQPEHEKSTEFKQRLKRYMFCILLITMLMDVATAGHATIFALLNNGTSSEGLEWEDFVFGVTWMLYGVSYSLVQLFYVRFQLKFGAFGTGAIGCFIKLIGCALIPSLTAMCRESESINNQWLELLIHSPASILNGVGYGLSCTATQTVISDYAKRYDVRSVGHWLGAWMAAIAMGMAGVIVLGIISEIVGPANTFYVCSLCAAISCLMYLVLAHIASDIPIACDLKQVIRTNERMTERLDGLEDIDEFAEQSVSRISRTGRLSTISHFASSLSVLSPPTTVPMPSTPNMLNLQTMPSDSAMTTCSLSRRDIADSVTRSSALHSLSSFNVSAPFGPLPIITPSALLGLPMNHRQRDKQRVTQRVTHIDLKTLDITVDAKQQSTIFSQIAAKKGEEKDKDK